MCVALKKAAVAALQDLLCVAFSLTLSLAHSLTRTVALPGIFNF